MDNYTANYEEESYNEFLTREVKDLEQVAKIISRHTYDGSIMDRLISPLIACVLDQKDWINGTQEGEERTALINRLDALRLEIIDNTPPHDQEMYRKVTMFEAI